VKAVAAHVEAAACPPAVRAKVQLALGGQHCERAWAWLQAQPPIQLDEASVVLAATLVDAAVLTASTLYPHIVCVLGGIETSRLRSYLTQSRSVEPPTACEWMSLSEAVSDKASIPFIAAPIHLVLRLAEAGLVEDAATLLWHMHRRPDGFYSTTNAVLYLRDCLTSPTAPPLSLLERLPEVALRTHGWDLFETRAKVVALRL
jgi:hypothetical protein